MLQRSTKVLESATVLSHLSHTQAGLIFVPVDISGTITKVVVECSANLAGGGSALFNIRLNGVSQWSGGSRLSIASGARLGSKSGLSIAVSENDDILLDLEQMPGIANITLPIVVTITIDDGVSDVSAQDYTVEFEQDFTTNALDSHWQTAGIGASISGGKGVLLPTANDGLGSTYPRFQRTASQSMVNKCAIIKILEKPEAGSVGNMSFGFDIGAYGTYWDLVSAGALYVTGNNSISPVFGDTFDKHVHWLRIRIASKGTGSNAHIIYYEYSFNGTTWVIAKADKVTSVNFDNVLVLAVAASYSGTTPTACYVEKIIIGTMNM